jgi:hypothetical protein
MAGAISLPATRSDRHLAFSAYGAQWGNDALTRRAALIDPFTCEDDCKRSFSSEKISRFFVLAISRPHAPRRGKGFAMSRAGQSNSSSEVVPVFACDVVTS